MWRKSILFSLVAVLAFSFAFAEASNVIGEDNTRIGLIKAKLENNEMLTQAEKDMAWENGLIEVQLAPTPYYRDRWQETASSGIRSDLELTFEDDSDVANWSHHDEGNVYTTETWDATAGVDGTGGLVFGDAGYTFLVKRPVDVPAGAAYALSIEIKNEVFSATNPLNLSITGLSTVEPSMDVAVGTEFVTYTLEGVADAGTAGYIRLHSLGGTEVPVVTIDNVLFDEEVVEPYFAEGFEVWPPVGWTLDPADGDGAWLQDMADDYGPGTVVEGTYTAFFNDYDYSSGTTGTMTSPAIDLSAATGPRLSFWYYDAGSSDFVDVLASTDNVTFTSVYMTDATVSPWEELVVDLAAYAGESTVYIQFAGSSVWGSSNPHIDAISIYEGPTDPIIGLSAAELAFGGVILGMSADEVLTISNTGGADLNVASIVASDDAFTVDVSSGVVAPGATLDVTVTFAPAMSMDYTADLTITSDDAGSPAVIALTGSGAPTMGGPDAAGYTWVNSIDGDGPTYAWIDTVGATQSGIAGGDDYRGTVNLPFTFRYYGNLYTEITPTTNGWVGLGPSTDFASSYWTNTDLPSATLPDNMIAPLWDDFKAGEAVGSTSSAHGKIMYKTLGVEPNRQFVVIFHEIVRGTYDTDYFTFEVILDEATSDITFQYLDVMGNTSADNGVGATIGLENADASIGLLYSYNGAPQMIYDEMAIQFVAPPPPSLPNIVLDMMDVDFGAIPAGASAMADVMITNNGTGDLVIASLDVAAPFSSTYSGTIAENTSATATISFDPTAAGSFAETLTITVTGDYTGDNEIALMGDAYPADFTAEGFEGDWPPFGWTIVDVDGGSAINPDLSYIDPHTGEVAAEGMGCADDYLITPLLAIPTGYATMSFWHGQESTSYENSFEVMVSTTGTAPEDFVQVADFPNTVPPAADAWSMESVDLSAYAEMEVYVAIHVYYSESSYYGFGLDDFILPPFVPSSNTLFFSEYLEGSSNNKAIEIYNGTGVEVDLSDYVILRYNNGAITGADSTSLTGMLANDEVYVIANSSADQGILDAADETGTVTYYNGNDFLGLVYDANGDDIFDIATEVVDVIGVLGEDPGSTWPVAGGLGATGEYTLMRKETVETGNTDWALSAGTSAEDSEWMVYEQDYWYGLGYHNEAYPGPGDVCELAIELTLPVVDLAGTSDGFNDDYSGASSYMGGIDIVYSFSIPEDGSISGSVVDAGSEWTGLFVMDGCPDDEEAVVIAQGTGSSGGSFMDVAIAAGDYYLIVSNYPTPNDFTYTLNLSYMVGPPPMADFIVNDMWSNEDTVFAEVMNQGDANSAGYFGTDYHGWFVDDAYLGYASGPALEAGASEVFMLTGVNFDNLGAGIFEMKLVADVDNDVEESDEENNADSLDVEIAFPPSVPRNVTAELAFTTATLMWETAPIQMEVARFSTGASNDLAAANAIAKTDKNALSTAMLEMKAAQQAEVNAYQAKTASSMRDLRETGDTCDDPFTLTLPAVDETGSSDGFVSDYTYAGNSYMNGIDVVYTFNIPEEGSITGSLVDGGSQWTGVFVFADCPSAGGEPIAMGTGASGGSFANIPISAGDYYLVVSNWPTPNDFTYTLNLTFTAGAVPMVDFVVSDIWLDDGAVYAVVTNQGDADSEGYLGGGTDYHSWSVDAVPLGYASGPSLAAAASDTFALTGFEYSAVGPGTFAVDFIADVDNDIVESDEANNMASLQVVIEEPDYIPSYNVYRNGTLVAEDLPPIDFAFNGGYVDAGLEFGEACYVITQNMEDESESEDSDEVCVYVTPLPAMDLVGSAADAVTNLSWLPPLVIETGWVAFHDGTFENGFSSTDGGAGLATLFTPMVYPAIVEQVRFHTGGGDAATQELQVYILADDGMTVLDGPHTVNGVFEDWITIDIADITIESGGFMVATYNTLAGGPYVDVDENNFLGNLYFGDHVNGFSELGSLGYEYVGSHEAYLNYDGEAVLVSADLDNSNYPSVLGTPSKENNIASASPAPATINTNHSRASYGSSAVVTRDLIGYNVYRGTDMDALELLTLATDTFYVDMSVENGMTYYYEVTALYDEGESLPTNMVELTPQGAAAIPYFSDFEVDGGGFAGEGEWAWGAPMFVDGPDSAWSGDNLWGTVLDGQYSNSSLSFLSQPFDMTDVTGTIVLSFSTWFEIETNWDNGYVVLDHDNDGIFDILGTFTGYPDEWMAVDIVIPDSLTSDYARLGFALQTDSSVPKAGFYIDDVSVVGVPLPAIALDVDEDFGVFLHYGDTGGSDDFSILNEGVADLDYTLSYDIAAGRNTGTREIDGAHAYSTTWPVPVGTTMDLNIFVQNESSDAEWIDSVYIAFPTGITINSITNMDGVGNDRYLEAEAVSGTEGFASWFNWDGGYGNIYGADMAMATVNVTIDVAYTGDVMFDWFLAGDVFGDEPHQVAGTFVFMEPALEIAVSPMAGTIVPAGADQITGTVTVNRYEEGFYPGFITILSNDAQNSMVMVPFNIGLGGPAGMLAGTVTSAYDDAPMQDVMILVVETTTLEEHFTMTMVDGSYEMVLPVGNYVVLMGYEEYHIVETSVDITLDATTVLDMAMVPDVDAPVGLTATEDTYVYLNWGMETPVITEGFENGLIPEDWQNIDHDGDENAWGVWDLFVHDGLYSLASFSWSGVTGLPLTPNNYLITPEIEMGAGAELSFWVGASDPLWYAEHFDVMLSTTGSSPADFTVELLDYTLTTDVWTEVTVDLSAYEGLNVYIAWVHNDVTDVFNLSMDDIALVDGAGTVLFSSTFETPAEVEQFQMLPFRTNDDMTDAEIDIRLTEYENQDSGLRSEFSHFVVYSNVEGAGWNEIGTTVTPDFVDESAVVGVPMEYKVSAMYDIGESDYSNVAAITLVSTENAGIPDTYALNQNYPNPFNPITFINYQLPEAANVKIVVYNVLGQKVATLVDQSMNAGYHSVSWSGLNQIGSPVSSGVYLYRIEADNFSDVKKLMYLK